MLVRPEALYARSCRKTISDFIPCRSDPQEEYGVERPNGFVDCRKFFWHFPETAALSLELSVTPVRKLLIHR